NLITMLIGTMIMKLDEFIRYGLVIVAVCLWIIKFIWEESFSVNISEILITFMGVLSLIHLIYDITHK
ncbi:hypothetical protein, partial [Pseudolactococcus laudensis]|uniref:hypothetical protein n=1 Tax=Pseudolactococcus laudensis TaxID=1494461 RepID=UPI003F94A4BA